MLKKIAYGVLYTPRKETILHQHTGLVELFIKTINDPPIYEAQLLIK